MAGAEGETCAQRKEVAEALRILGRGSAPGVKGDRDWAAHVLLTEMEHWAPTIIWKAQGRWLRELAVDEVESLIADAVQSLALVASTSQSYFRGEGEASARAWCRSVLLNHVSNELRARKARRRIHAADLAATWAAGGDQPPEPVGTTGDRRPALDQLASALRVLRSIRIRIFSSHRRRDAETTMRAVWCYLAYLSGASLEEQVRALSIDDAHASDPPSEYDARARRHRNRVYKLRERGRKALHVLWTDDVSNEPASAPDSTR